MNSKTRFLWGFLLGIVTASSFLLLPFPEKAAPTRPSAKQSRADSPTQRPSLDPTTLSSNKASPAFTTALVPPTQFQSSFLLKTESPGDAERWNALMSEMMTSHISIVRPGYEALFRSYGLPDDTVLKLADAEEAVAKAKFIERFASMQMSDAMKRYDDLVLQAIPDKFQDYLALEEVKPALKELAFIQQFAASSNVAGIPPAEEEAVVELLTRIKPYTMLTQANFFGPFENPAPTVGGRMIGPYLRSMNARLTAQSGQLVNEARASGRLSAESVSLLERHFANEMKKNQASIDRADLGTKLRLESKLRVR